MARPGAAATRNMSLTEELERLEQSITITLQEIDSNFAKAHRIVTTSILPIVERYARNSEAFWKHFFEASANVSLSNYAEPAMDDSALHSADADDGQGASGDSALEHASGTGVSQAYDTGDDEDDTITSPPSATQRRVAAAAAAAGAAGSSDDGKADDDSDVAALLSSPSLAHSHSTPRQPASSHHQRRYVADDRPSPYEAMRREMRGEPASGAAAAAAAPTTPGKRPPALPDMNMTPAGSSPFAVPTAAREANKDTILHQGILGRTYRVAATPLTAQRTLRMFGNDRDRDDVGLSSPEMDDDDDEPQLHAEIFSSPVRPVRPPAPGTSVLTPRRKGAVDWRREERRRSSKGLRGEDTGEPGGNEEARGRGGYTARSILDWASDDDEMPEMSPPKTMRFDFGGQPVIQTPAREASQKIVQDLLYSAGGDINNDPDEYSPSIIVKESRFQDDTF